jgi:nickel-type superoxide dismutase maturation protease
MWPTYTNGQRLECSSDLRLLEVGSVVVFIHPLRSQVRAIKRIKDVDEKSLFVEGDHPDPLASEDSHNFGRIPRSNVVGIVLNLESE